MELDSRGILTIDGVAADRLVADFGSPLYVISESTVRQNFKAVRGAFSERWPAPVNASDKAGLHARMEAIKFGFGLETAAALTRRLSSACIKYPSDCKHERARIQCRMVLGAGAIAWYRRQVLKSGALVNEVGDSRRVGRADDNTY